MNKKIFPSLFVCLLSYNFSITLTQAQFSIWDAKYNILSTPFPEEKDAAIVDLDVQRMIMYPANSTQAAFLPAAFQLPLRSNASIMIRNCYIYTLCSTVSDYITFMEARAPDNIMVRLPHLLSIINYTARSDAVSVVISNLTLQCSEEMSASFQAAQVYANSSSSFQAAISALSSLGVSGIITLDGPARVSAEGWPSSGYLMGKGASLTITSSEAGGILDLGMSFGEIKLPTGPLKIMGGVTVMNLCTAVFNIQGRTILSTFGIYAFTLPESPWGSGIKTNLYKNITMIVPRGDVEGLIYWTALYPSPFLRINDYAILFTRSFPNNYPEGFVPAPDTLNLTTYETNSMAFANTVVIPSDLPQVGSTAGFSQNKPTSCNPNQIVSEQRMNDNSFNPLYQITDIKPVEAVLPEALKIISRPVPPSGYYPPLIMQFVNSSLVNWPGASAVKIAADLVWVGPTIPKNTINSEKGGNPTSVVLDLQQLQSAIHLQYNKSSPSAFHMQRLTLVNLSESSGSAMPLWIFEFNRSNTQIMLESVTIVLPLSTYASLYALAKIGGLQSLSSARKDNPSWASIQNPWLSNITKFDVTRVDTSSLLLSNFASSGVQATNLLLTSDTYFEEVNSTVPSPAPSESNGRTKNIIVGVVVGIIGNLIALAILAAVFVMVKRRKQKKLLALENLSSGVSTDLPPNSKMNGNEQASQNVSGFKETKIASWDPMKEVQLMVGQVQGQQDGEMLNLLEPIGKGGFGTVFLGRWRNLDVAVKTVLFTCQGGREAASSVERQAITEAAVATSVVHPYVVSTYHYDIRPVTAVRTMGGVQIHEGEQSEWKLFLVQELCDVSLADTLESKFFHDNETMAPFVKMILNVLKEVGEGMAYLHGKQIIHGDLKPENVLLKHTTENEFGITSKITDFGFSAHMDPTKSHISGVLAGTRFYSAPEVNGFIKDGEGGDLRGWNGKALPRLRYKRGGDEQVNVAMGVPPFVKKDNNLHMNPTFMRLPAHCPQLYRDLAQRCVLQDPKARPEFPEIVSTLQELITGYSLDIPKIINTGNQSIKRTSDTLEAASLDDKVEPPPVETNNYNPDQILSCVSAGVTKYPVTQESLISFRGSKQAAAQNYNSV